MENRKVQQSELSRYKWLIRPLFHRNAIASLDWIGKSAPVPLLLLASPSPLWVTLWNRAWHTHTHKLYFLPGRLAFRFCFGFSVSFLKKWGVVLRGILGHSSENSEDRSFVIGTISCWRRSRVHKNLCSMDSSLGKLFLRSFYARWGSQFSIDEVNGACARSFFFSKCRKTKFLKVESFFQHLKHSSNLTRECRATGFHLADCQAAAKKSLALGHRHGCKGCQNFGRYTILRLYPFYPFLRWLPSYDFVFFKGSLGVRVQFCIHGDQSLSHQPLDPCNSPGRSHLNSLNGKLKSCTWELYMARILPANLFHVDYDGSLGIEHSQT